MPRYKAVIMYDGTNFSGFQSQPGGARTVQSELEKTLTRMNRGQALTIYGSGRTDAGVHALGQVIHFDYEEVASLEKLRYGMDTQTPDDIAVRSVKIVPDDFHARYLVKEKTYAYIVDYGKPRNPLARHQTAHFPYPLDLVKMQRVMDDFLGTHDYTGFCASGSSVKDKERTVYEATMQVDEQRQQIRFVFRGNGFLYKMVRNMVGTVLKIGNGRLPEDAIKEAIRQKNRQLAGPTAPPEGLYLVEVSYQDA